MSASTDHSTDQDVLDLPATDHREFFELLDQMESTTDGEQRRDLADQLIGELVRRSVAEEMHVYPVLRDHVPGGDAAVDHDTSEHKELEGLMKQLESADAGSTEFSDVVTQIRAALRDHVEDEEGERFPTLRRHCRPSGWSTSRARSRPRRSWRRPGRTRWHPTPSCSTRRSARASGWSTGCATS